MSWMYRTVGRVANFQLTLAAIGVLAILLTISLDVFLRAAFNAPFSATIEIVSYYYMIPVVFFPMMYLEHTGTHIDTDLFYGLFPTGLQKFSDLVSGLITIGIYGLIGFVTFKQAITSTQSGEVAMGVNLLPIWPVRWILPIVFISAAFAATLLTIHRILKGTDDA
jgi:TRAP-type C4-dicarboxylate transport system permease small subunit